MVKPSPTPSPRIHWTVALIPLVVLIALQVVVIREFGSDALDGASQTALLFAAAVAVAMGMIFYKIPWSSIDSAIGQNIKTIGPAILILFFISALVSLVTGSSWTTVATIGIALMGIGTAHGYSVGWTAGAIISGAYFGDKISPLSDTTVLASSVGEVPLFKHIRYMLITTVPSFTIALTIFLVASLCHTTDSGLQTELFADGLQRVFVISPWLLIVPVVTGVLIALRMPAAIVLFLSALTAGVTMLIAQPDIVAQIGEGNSFRGLMLTYCSSTSIDTGNETLTSLVQTRGMRGMLSTVFLIFCAAAFGGALAGAGMIQSITSALAKGISGRRSLVSTTVATGLFANMATGDQYLSIVLTGNIYKKLYKEKGFEGRLLSRSTEDSATVTSVLVPWNTCGMTQSLVLRVPTIEYLPYCFFNIVSPLMSIFIAMLGYKIFRHTDNL